MNQTSTPKQRLHAALDTLPLVAILRGIEPASAQDIGRCLHDAGFRLIEVPLNSPDPLQSIATLRRTLPTDTLVGAGTVLTPEQVSAVQRAGGELIVMPHTDSALIRVAVAAGLACMPGVTTPSDAFAALAAGADALKIFPAELVTPRVLKAIKVVLPAGTRLLPVGGITPEGMRAYVEAGAAGFGLGSALFTLQMSLADIAGRAAAFVEAWRQVGR